MCRLGPVPVPLALPVDHVQNLLRALLSINGNLCIRSLNLLVDRSLMAQYP